MADINDRWLHASERWRDAWAVYAWTHPSWDSRLILRQSEIPFQYQRETAEGYLGDGEPRELLSFSFCPFPKADFANLREWDG